MSSSTTLRAANGFILGLNDSTLALLASAIALFAAALWCAHGPNAEKTDFSLTYVGARIVHQGLGRSLYDISLQKQVRDSLFQHPSPLLFEHPPFEALVLSPLAALPFRSAYLLWNLFNAIVWLALIFFLRRYLPWPHEDFGYLALWFSFAPLGVALYQGQSSILLLALYSVCFVCLSHEKESLAGIALGVGLFKFQFVLPFLLIFVFRRKWRFLYGFAATSLLLFVLSVFTVRWSGLAAYVRFVLAIGSNPQNESYGSAVDMPTLYGLLYAIFSGRISPSALNSILAVLSILLLGLVAWQWQQAAASNSFDLMFAASIAVSLLTSSHMFTHDFSPLILPMFLAAAYLSSCRPPTWMLRLPLVLLWAFPLYFCLVALHSLYLMCCILLLFTYSAMKAAEGLSRNQLESAVQ